MNKSQFYLSQCAEAASKSTMYYTLGSVLVKGGKVISTGFNHQRPNYDSLGKGMAPSMHAGYRADYHEQRWRAYLTPPVAKPRGKSSKFNRAREQGHGKQHANEQNNNLKKTMRKAEEQHRDLEARRRASLVPHEGPPRRTFYPARQTQYEYHQRGQEHETEPASEANGPGARGTAQKQRRRRARNSRLNGADLYVCRVTPAGFGCARPCWRCVEWCAWAGIRRIFHWSTVEGRFVCLKVGGALKEECYQTITDCRYFTGQSFV
ncbi:hypothetical protein DFH07DRAFT_969236 [Mycena maculata]|uniref:CMP/dCMP-type deaminase domain-containing protein n=1 Tax=Mycena maculata TaxID=230809 RepID=A0AAD7HX15_9AGAR|nr:hypothetical protein DFH07DRAFT_969236 [Mycena maculata]